MDITQLLNGALGQQVIQGIGKQAGTSAQDTSAVIQAAAPVLMGMLQQNASSSQGATSLLNALNQHDGSILSSLTEFLKTGDTKDGNGILRHILGSNKDKVEQAISKQTNVSTANVAKIIALLAPILMGYLGQQKKSKKVQSSNGLGDLLGSITGDSGTASNIGASILSSILNQKSGGAGNILSDIIGAVTSDNKKGSKKGGSGLADALGSLFGKK